MLAEVLLCQVVFIERLLCEILTARYCVAPFARHSNTVLAGLPLQVISIACLYLGGKVEDSPKSVKDVIYACVEWRYKKYQPETFQRLFDRVCPTQ